MDRREERVERAVERLRDAEALVAAGWPVQLGSGDVVSPRAYHEAARMELREAVILWEANHG
jgi:hypothetical protein